VTEEEWDAWEARRLAVLRNRRETGYTVLGAKTTRRRYAHGGSSQYNRMGCRCALCVEWKREHRKRTAERKRAERGPVQPAEITHTAYRYSLGCRCDECCAAYREKKTRDAELAREQRRARKEAS
jgi:hypothetical protein